MELLPGDDAATADGEQIPTTSPGGGSSSSTRWPTMGWGIGKKVAVAGAAVVYAPLLLPFLLLLSALGLVAAFSLSLYLAADKLTRSLVAYQAAEIKAHGRAEFKPLDLGGVDGVEKQVHGSNHEREKDGCHPAQIIVDNMDVEEHMEVMGGSSSMVSLESEFGPPQSISEMDGSIEVEETMIKENDEEEKEEQESLAKETKAHDSREPVPEFEAKNIKERTTTTDDEKIILRSKGLGPFNETASMEERPTFKNSVMAYVVYESTVVDTSGLDNASVIMATKEEPSTSISMPISYDGSQTHSESFGPSFECSPSSENQLANIGNAESSSSLVTEIATRRPSTNEDTNIEEELWNQIKALRVILGYKATPCLSYTEEIRALYLFTGACPPSPYKGSFNLLAARKELSFLKYIVGVE